MNFKCNFPFSYKIKYTKIFIVFERNLQDIKLLKNDYKINQLIQNIILFLY